MYGNVRFVSDLSVQTLIFHRHVNIYQMVCSRSPPVPTKVQGSQCGAIAPGSKLGRPPWVHHQANLVAWLVGRQHIPSGYVKIAVENGHL